MNVCDPVQIMHGFHDLRHAAVRQNMGESDTFSQTRTAYHADAADIRPRRSLLKP